MYALLQKLSMQTLSGRDSSPSSESALVQLDHQITLSSNVGITIAAATTILRLTLRVRYFGWDDVLAALALVSVIITVIDGKLYFDINPLSTRSQSSRVALYYVFAVTFDTTIWISRLSILFTIIRLGGYKRQLYTAAVCFLLAMLVLIAQIFWVCEPQNRHNHWKEAIVPQCVLGKSVAITQVTTDAFADIVLVTIPLYLLRYLKSEDAQAQKLRLAVSFVVGGLTSVVSIVHAVYLFNGLEISILVSNFEMVVSVIITNFAVLVAAWYRMWKSVRPLSRFAKNKGRRGGSSKESKLSSIAYGAPPRSGASASVQDQDTSGGGTGGTVMEGNTNASAEEEEEEEAGNVILTCSACKLYSPRRSAEGPLPFQQLELHYYYCSPLRTHNSQW
ncbi:hypothetical protein D9757_006756 [Collybiopsis confluens]|uniref:Rhodopsin domain-containing protein n=1 Tax=Collybiopsis confluens TaxID=2823264 RepID=A0A8H5M8U8_9AGAR|nr:hypothetical protein D9757_006756 [Collybiopsis confluens]